MRIATAVQVLGLTVLLSGCVGYWPIESQRDAKDQVTIDVTGFDPVAMRQEAELRCQQYNRTTRLRNSVMEGPPGNRHDTYDCIEMP
jgi:hypothetical protein